MSATTTDESNGAVSRSVCKEIASFRAQVPKEKLQEFEEPEGLWVCGRKIIRDWALIIVGHQVFVYSPGLLTALIAAMFMVWGQCGLICVGHDSIHGNLVKNRTMNDLLADLFCTPARFSTSKIQRAQHTAHHHYLGTEKDPDHGDGNKSSLKHYRTGRRDFETIFSLFLYDVFDWPLWSRALIASLPNAPVILTTWWFVVWALSLLFLEPRERFMLGPVPISSFAILFHLTRCTLGYAINVFREIIDHAGLPPSGGALHFTRTSPYGSLFQGFLQPHDDNYHVLHHILPKIPTSRYKSAHTWLMENVEEYRKANHYDTYFEGTKPLFGERLFQAR